MILNFRKMGTLEIEFLGGMVMVDDRAIEQAWYIDTSLGIVKSYDVAGEGGIRVFTAAEAARLFASDPTIEAVVEGGLLSRTIIGKEVVVFRAGESKPQ
jgi:hypothetical protein